jgi:hypothetical protein
MTKRKEHPKKAGRPSKYNIRFCAEMIAFFTREHYTKVEIERHDVQTKYGTNTNIKYKLVPTEIPFFESFARSIGVSYTGLLKWKAALRDQKSKKPRYPEFVDAYNICKQLQKEQLIDIGIVGATPPAAYIFTAKNITDMTDKQIFDETVREIRVTDGTEEGTDAPPA